ncbi:MAG: hypothetical protein LBT40_02485 [Deltaproteobacteria bacterium]|jgi:hypothetical protein|nr:hypothetical protein [Deltaproteobacteria bacterium]
MPPLKDAQRRRVETSVREARAVADAAARAELVRLGVQDPAPPASLDDAEKSLSLRLRTYAFKLAHRLGRQEASPVDIAAEDVSWEFWHGRLFARFLAERGLLVRLEPDGPVPVSLEDCFGTAVKEGARDGWELAARHAAAMLPGIFPPGSPVRELRLPEDAARRLGTLIDGMPPGLYTDPDGLGLTCEHWHAGRREEILAGGGRIGQSGVGCVTQRCTPQYIASFILDNTLGAWWAYGRLTGNDLEDASLWEEDLRSSASLPGMPLEYLRFVLDGDFYDCNYGDDDDYDGDDDDDDDVDGGDDDVDGDGGDDDVDGDGDGDGDDGDGDGASGRDVGDGGSGDGDDDDGDIDIDPDDDDHDGYPGCDYGDLWLPAAGTLLAWPESSLEDIKVMDPSCGSGNFLVSAMSMLVRMHLDGSTPSPRDAVDSVLRHNIHGLDIDRHSVATASFALSLAAWSWEGAGGYRPLPELNVAWTGRRAPEEADLLTLAGKNGRLRKFLLGLGKLFADGPRLGSLLETGKFEDLRLTFGGRGRVRGSFIKTAVEELDRIESPESPETAAEVRQLARAAALLIPGQYTLVVTDAPFLPWECLDDGTRAVLAGNCRDSKGDMSAAFLDGCCSAMCGRGGMTGTVTSQDWLDGQDFRNLRKNMLSRNVLRMLARLGERAFGNGHGSGTSASILIMSPYDRKNSKYSDGTQVDHTPVQNVIYGLKAEGRKTPKSKAAKLASGRILWDEQKYHMDNPEKAVDLEPYEI